MAENKIYTVLIAEDEMPARELLVDFLVTHQELKLSGIAKNGEEALDMLTKNKYDLLLLDIHLPILSGIEVLEKIKKDIPYVIFTTAYDQYAIKAFDLGAVDYLLKPFSLERFDQAINKFLIIKKDNKPYLTTTEELGLSFKEKEKHYLVSYQDIAYLSSNGKHTIIHTDDKDFETSSIIKDIEQKLPPNIFIRVHKQYIVNIHYVSHIEYNLGGQYIAYLKDKDDSSLPVGRTYASTLREKLGI